MIGRREEQQRTSQWLARQLSILPNTASAHNTILSDDDQSKEMDMLA